MPLVLTVLDEIMGVLMERLETLNNSAEQTDVVDIIQPTRLGTWTPKDLQVVVIQGEQERVPELDCPGNPPAECNRQIVNLYCHVRSSESDTEAVDKTINAFAADVKKVVCTPSNTWHNFASYPRWSTSGIAYIVALMPNTFIPCFFRCRAIGFAKLNCRGYLPVSDSTVFDISMCGIIHQPTSTWWPTQKRIRVDSSKILTDGVHIDRQKVTFDGSHLIGDSFC